MDGGGEAAPSHVARQRRRGESHAAGAGSAPAMLSCMGRLRVWHWLRDFAISLALAFLCVLFLYQPVRVEGFSMLPELTNNERIFINRVVYRVESIQHGDVVVFWFPLDPTKSFIKRVIGVPGDRVRIVNGTVYVNGQELNEPYVRPGFRDDSSYPETVVPPQRYFVLGDHRNSSSDSRIWGCVEQQAIYGKAVFAYWPMQRVGLVR